MWYVVLVASIVGFVGGYFAGREVQRRGGIADAAKYHASDALDKAKEALDDDEG